MRLYTVLTEVIEIDVPDNEFAQIDFNEANKLAALELASMLVLNDPNDIGFRHYAKYVDAYEHVEEV